MIRLPSTDLYFANACRDWIAARWDPRRAPVRRIGPNSFMRGEWLIVIREERAAMIRRARDWPGRIAYVIDDDAPAAAECPTLPAAYRRRMAAFVRDCHAPLVARVDVILAASDGLAEALTAQRPDAAIRRIDPVWCADLADQAHFAVPEAGGALRIVHLGSGSHGPALARVAPAILALLTTMPAAQFTYFAERPIDPALEAHPRGTRLQPKPWPEYQRWLARQRFHLALYPLLDTAFDRARSANKLREHAIVGAAGLYPEWWQPARALGAGALTAPAEPAQWHEALRAATNPAMLRAVAAEAARRLAGEDQAARQRALWAELLGLSGCARRC